MALLRARLRGAARAARWRPPRMPKGRAAGRSSPRPSGASRAPSRPESAPMESWCVQRRWRMGCAPLEGVDCWRCCATLHLRARGGRAARGGGAPAAHGHAARRRLSDACECSECGSARCCALARFLSGRFHHAMQGGLDPSRIAWWRAQQHRWERGSWQTAGSAASLQRAVCSSGKQKEQQQVNIAILDGGAPSAAAVQQPVRARNNKGGASVQTNEKETTKWPSFVGCAGCHARCAQHVCTLSTNTVRRPTLPHATLAGSSSTAPTPCGPSSFRP